MAIFVNMRGGEDFADINEDRSGARIGERIKKIRVARELSRAELGKLIGLDHIRVQQYENGTRKPKIPLLKKFAAALGVETIALMDPNIDSYVAAMHSLFQMEEKLDLKVMMKDGCYCLQFGDGKSDSINRYLSQWYDVRKALYEALPDLCDEERKKKIFEYNMFQWTYPSGITTNGRKYNEHPINRMNEINEDYKHFKDVMDKLDKDEERIINRPKTE